MVVAETILNFFLVFLSNYIAQNVIRDIREKAIINLFILKLLSFDKTAIGNLVLTRAVGDVETIATVYTDGFLMVFGDIFESGFRFGSDVSGKYGAELYFAYHFTYHVVDYKVFQKN